MMKFILGSCSGVLTFPRHISCSTRKNHYDHGPAVYVRSAAKRSLTWESDLDTEDDTKDAPEADETNSIMSQFDRASDEDFDPGYVSEDSLCAASESSTCIDMLSDQDLDEYEDEDAEAADSADDAEDDPETSHALCCERRYERVRVMSMIWDVPGFLSKHGPVTVDQEMKDPMRSFKDYQYEVEKFTIPSTLPTERLREKFQQYRKSLEHENSETLLIFWYNGHGNIVGYQNDLVLCG
ncbi:hypothetical protein CKAH01_16880 [Colletotrichum kahawae]|uniref:Uncharacterized protein n=1 Tax=Colletotrichum kahawae TaxID=34407 RepID=A0AAD9YCT1_COLKA|nr:hypothetical protein CKAH01_16880 [Colletotrichum kahawae]